jgi:GDPmannose 4,6-dehydratase
VRALITGITGQDGPYLAVHLEKMGYEVFGTLASHDRYGEPLARQRAPGMKLVAADLLDPWSICAALEKVGPDEIYNLAALTFVPASWDHVELTALLTGLGPVRVLEAVRQSGASKVRVYQACSSEMFGHSPPPQSETTPFHPVSPYACAKVFAHQMCDVYRRSYGMYVVSGILFNHESPWRGAEFVTRHVTKGLAEIKAGRRDYLPIGRLTAVRDWGYAADYMEAVHLMLQQPTPADLVIGTGVGRTVGELVSLACSLAGLDPEKVVKHDEARERPLETANLIADPTRAFEELGWRPRTSFDELIEMMLAADVDRAAAGEILV